MNKDKLFEEADKKTSPPRPQEQFTEDHIEKLAGLFGDDMMVPDDDEQDTGEFKPVNDEDDTGSFPPAKDRE